MVEHKCAVCLTVDRTYFDLGLAQAIHISTLTDADVHLFCDDKTTPETSTSQSGRLFIHHNRLLDFIPANAVTRKNWPLIVYARLFAPFYLAGYDRILYLDADVAVVGDCGPLFATDMQDHTVAAVRDPIVMEAAADPQLRPQVQAALEAVGIRSDRYFNGGVLLFEANRYRTLDIRQDLLAFIDAYGENIRACEQDFMNFRFQNAWLELNPRWNFTSVFLNSGFERLFDPVIYHFTHLHRPWERAFWGRDRRFIRYFDDIAEAAGKSSHVFPSRAHGRVKQLRNAIRSFLYDTGIRKHIPARKLAQLRSDRETVRHFIREAMSQGYFEFEKPVRIEELDVEPPVVFRGHYAFYE